MAWTAKGNEAWVWGGAVALAGHAAVLAGVLVLGAAAPAVLPEEPVVLVELPPEGGATAALQPAAIETARPQPQPAEITPAPAAQPKVEAPRVNAPLPTDALTMPPPERPAPMPRPAPRIAASAPVAAPSPTPPAPARAVVPQGQGTGSSDVAGDDPKAKREQADYFSLLKAHLNRKKQYPSEAKKARQQGVVTVRFTVHSDGAISNVSIKDTSGHALLDQATLALMQRVAPLPQFPKSMTRDSVTLALPIDYSLRTR